MQADVPDDEGLKHKHKIELFYDDIIFREN